MVMVKDKKVIEIEKLTSLETKCFEKKSSYGLIVSVDKTPKALVATRQGILMPLTLVTFFKQLMPSLNKLEIRIPDKGTMILNEANGFVPKMPSTTVLLGAGRSPY